MRRWNSCRIPCSRNSQSNMLPLLRQSGGCEVRSRRRVQRIDNKRRIGRMGKIQIQIQVTRFIYNWKGKHIDSVVPSRTKHVVGMASDFEGLRWILTASGAYSEKGSAVLQTKWDSQGRAIIKTSSFRRTPQPAYFVIMTGKKMYTVRL